MLPIYIQETAADFTTLLPLLVLCCVVTMLFRGGGQQEAPRAEFDSWYLNSAMQEAYDTVVKEVDEWREKAMYRKRGRFSAFSRKKPKVFAITSTVPPRLLSVDDDKAGSVTFEFIDMEGGNTFIKATYGPAARTLIQSFKAETPIKAAIHTQVISAAPNTCPSCGKEMMSDYKLCPFCGAKLK